MDCPSDSTVVALDAMLADADVALANGAIAVDAARLSLQLSPEIEGHIEQGTLGVEGLSVASSGTQFVETGESCPIGCYPFVVSWKMWLVSLTI